MNTRTRAVVAAMTSTIVLVAVTGVILYFGFIPLPEFPSLAERPDRAIPGTMAFSSSGEEGYCIHTMLASGGPVHDVTCRGPSGPLGWTAQGELVAGDFSGDRFELVVLDPEAGFELRRFPSADGAPLGGDRSVRGDGARIVVEALAEGSSQVLVVEGGVRRTVLMVSSAPRDYYLRSWGQQWSPDGAWIAVWDSEGRLLLMGATGTPEARMLVDADEFHGDAAWFIAGNPTYTVEVPEG